MTGSVCNVAVLLLLLVSTVRVSVQTVARSAQTTKTALYKELTWLMNVPAFNDASRCGSVRRMEAKPF